jgi:hypothetical protein
MANKDAAFGLRPMGKVGQNRDNQGLSEYDISASASAIYFNDPVEILAAGTIGVAAAGDEAILGSLGGVFFTDASTTAAADVGLNADFVYAAGSSPDYVSKVELDTSDQKTGTAQLRILGISKDPDNNEAGSANVNLVVLINEHQLKGTTGV